MEEILAKLSSFAEVKTNMSFKTLTTLRIGGNAAYVVYPSDVIALHSIVKYLNENDIPYKIFGKGSNILCSDDDYNGVIIRLDNHFDRAYFDGDEIVAQAGCSIITLAYEAMKKGLTGLEWASGIPGTLGGCVYMNAGAYKASMKDIIEEVLVLKDNELVWMNKEDCRFAYRHSVFQDHHDWIVLAAKLKLAQGDIHEIRDLMDQRKERRMNSQPLNYPSAGSVFRNPEEASAWSLIDGIGYRGYSNGGAMVSDKHVNFIVNNNNATGKDFLGLVEDIQFKVKEKYGIDLIMEVEKFNWQ